MKTTALILIISLFGGLVKQDKPTKSADNSQIISHLDEKIDINKNIVYASTFREKRGKLQKSV